MIDIDYLIINLFRFVLPALLTFFILYPFYLVRKLTSGFSWKLLGGFLAVGFIVWLVLIFIAHWIISMFKTDNN